MNKVVIYILHKMEQHPAQGLIEMLKVNGTSNCFGSSITSDSHVVIKIYKAETEWKNTTERHYKKKLLIQLKLTHYQFVELIMSSASSQPVPCTLQSVAGERIDEYVLEDKLIELYESDITESLNNSFDKITELSYKLEELETKPRVTKKALQELKQLVSSINIELRNNVPWIIEKFNEEMENKYSKIKSEASAWISQRINTIGMKKLLK